MTRTAEPRSSTAPDTTTPVPSGARLAGGSTHPWAWWGWAVGAAVVATMTTNPLLLALVLTAVLLVTLARRSDAPWARSVSAFLVLGLVVIGFRVVLITLLGGARGGVVLFTLPELQLPTWMAGIRLGGPVSLNAIMAALNDGLRLATILVCVGAANALANPRQALKTVPAAMNQLSVAVVIALSVAPQLVESVGRVRRARRLRGGTAKGLRAVTSIIVPVLQDALERSMRLATAMESRGYGRTLRTGPSASATWAGVLLVAGLLGLVASTYAIFAVAGAELLGPLGMAASITALLVGLNLSGRSQRISRYRPHPWGWRDTAVVLSGVAAAVAAGWVDLTDHTALHPSVQPLEWPRLTIGMLTAVALLAAPLALTRAPAPTTVRRELA